MTVTAPGFVILASAVGSCVLDSDMKKILFACGLLAAWAAHARTYAQTPVDLTTSLPAISTLGDESTDAFFRGSIGGDDHLNVAGADLCRAECTPIDLTTRQAVIAPEMDWSTAIAAFSLLAGGAFILKVQRGKRAPLGL